MDSKVSFYLNRDKVELGNHNKVVLLDYCSEKNRGDAAMQVGLLKLVFRFIKEPIISIITVFGSNQSGELLQEYDHSINWPVKILGGLKPTYFPINNHKVDSLFPFEFKQGIMFFVDLVFLLLISLKIPIKLIKYIVPRGYHETIDAINNADLVIWNGRNFRSRKNHLIEFYRTLHVVFHPLVCIALKKPIACVGASLWHLHNPLSRMLMRYTFNKCFFVSFREELSYKEARILLGRDCKTELALLPDLSFAMYEEGKKIKHNRAPISNNTYPKVIGFTIVDWAGDGYKAREEYKTAIKDVIRFYLKHNSRIVIIPQVTKTWEDNNALITEIIKDQKNNENISIIMGEPTVEELLINYSKLDFLIATRMHSAIFASFVGTPLVVISYDAGGKWSIIQELGYRDYLINYSDISYEKLIDKINNCWSNKNQILTTIENETRFYAERVEQNILRIIEIAPIRLN